MSKHTAIFGLSKNKEKSSEEIVKIKCRVQPYKELNSESSDSDSDSESSDSEV